MASVAFIPGGAKKPKVMDRWQGHPCAPFAACSLCRLARTTNSEIVCVAHHVSDAR